MLGEIVFDGPCIKHDKGRILAQRLYRNNGSHLHPRKELTAYGWWATPTTAHRAYQSKRM
jgi:hypothetical protein